MKADLAIYTHVLGVPGQYESVALMLSHKWISIVVPIGTVFANPVTYVVVNYHGWHLSGINGPLMCLRLYLCKPLSSI